MVVDLIQSSHGPTTNSATIHQAQIINHNNTLDIQQQQQQHQQQQRPIYIHEQQFNETQTDNSGGIGSNETEIHIQQNLEDGTVMIEHPDRRVAQAFIEYVHKHGLPNETQVIVSNKVKITSINNILH